MSKLKRSRSANDIYDQFEINSKKSKTEEVLEIIAEIKKNCKRPRPICNKFEIAASTAKCAKFDVESGKVVLQTAPDVVVSVHSEVRKVGVAAVFKAGECPITRPPTANKLNAVNEELAYGFNKLEL